MRNSGMILLVEDKPDDAELTMRAFRKSNINNEVCLARDGAEALEILKAESDSNSSTRNNKPDIAFVLLDLNMPRIDGLEVLKQIRAEENTSMLPVIIFSSSSEKNDIHESYRLGANSYIRKPVDYNRSNEIIKLLGDYWLSANQAPCPS